jgi:hypothetical protein
MLNVKHSHFSTGKTDAGEKKQSLARQERGTVSNM